MAVYHAEFRIYRNAAKKRTRLEFHVKRRVFTSQLQDNRRCRASLTDLAFRPGQPFLCLPDGVRRYDGFLIGRKRWWRADKPASIRALFRAVLALPGSLIALDFRESRRPDSPSGGYCSSPAPIGPRGDPMAEQVLG